MIIVLELLDTPSYVSSCHKLSNNRDEFYDISIFYTAKSYHQIKHRLEIRMIICYSYTSFVQTIVCVI